MSVDTIVRHLVVNVGDIDRGDGRIRAISLYDGSVGTEDTHEVYGLEFPIHKPDRSIKATGRENVGRPLKTVEVDGVDIEKNTPPFWPTAPLTEGQDDQTAIGCAVAGVCQIAPDADFENYVYLAFIAYHPETPDAGYCVAYLSVDTANAIADARWKDMNLVACNKQIPRQSNISLIVLPGITPSGVTPAGALSTFPGLTIHGLSGQFEYEIFA